MRKTVFAILMASAFGVQAADVGLSVGTDRKFDRDLTVLTVGTKVVGLHTSIDLSRVEGTYHSVGTSVGKTFTVFGVGLLPYTSLNYIRADTNALKHGGVAATGVELSYPLNKHLSVSADYSYRWDIKSDTNYEGSLITFGLKSTF
jgi:hypothetical protein